MKDYSYRRPEPKSNFVPWPIGDFKNSFRKEHDKLQLLWKIKGTARCCYSCGHRYPHCKERQYVIDYSGLDIKPYTTEDMKLVCNKWYR